MEKKNKPRVFLSHASKDRAFIEKLYNDLLKYKIAPWKDTEEIRDGRPWLKVIFEDGISTCDSIIVYLTKHSINSKMVAKEIDAAFIEQMSDNGITILPYIDDSQLRSELRPDIRSLQCREWNKHNYLEFLPSVVAEIWQSYVERVVDAAILKEKYENKSLEERYKKLVKRTLSSPFTKSQKKDFEYIKNY
ncbi:MAG: toll/interleukin-1 receptor domain-containing protein [bacterium]